MTELEFEKAARGPATVTPVPQSYVWGSSKIRAPAAIAGGGTASETVNEQGEDGLCNFNSVMGGPLRSGFAAGSGSSRLQSGSGYYGVMDLSGNLWEMVVSVGDSTGKNFGQAGVLNGQGVLSNGNAPMQYWPGYLSTDPYEVTGATGSGLRGGAWTSPVATSNNTSELHTSDRSKANVGKTTRDNDVGGRCVRNP
jgi:formylglycine-generating enzyme required for sulfatase activity